MRTLRLALAVFVTFTFAGPTAAATTDSAAGPVADPAGLMQLVDYIAVDYPAAVRDGAVISEAEFAEMKEFSARAVELATRLPASAENARIEAAGRRLAALVESRADASAVRDVAKGLREALIAGHPLPEAPRHAPDLAAAARLFAQHCAACHGPDGRGNGPAAATLDPAPTDFHDVARARQRSLLGLHSTITRGVDGTSMRAFTELSDEQRWALAWYVGGLHVGPAAPETASPAAGALPLDLARLTNASPAELEAAGVDPALIAALRRDPAPLFAADDPLAIARARLADAARALAAGDRAGAYAAALAAYLDGYELAEPGLRATHAERAAVLEREMLDLREAIRGGGEIPALTERIRSLDAALAELAANAGAAGALTPGVGFASSFFILLREGLEAILLVGLIVTTLVKTGRREALRQVHLGWGAALALGAVTWAVSSWLIVISGATREMTEGVAALLAAVVLFYVGFWLHDKLAAARWQAFLKEQLEGALSQGSRWTLVLLAFVVVYREVFETVLFYQALWLQSVEAAVRQSILLGGLAAVAALAAVWWAVFQLGMRLPLRQFFAVSAVFTIVLAVIFAGKGVAALQEAGRIPFSILPLPTVELLGIYPTAQSIGLQLVFVAGAIGFVLYNRAAERREARSAA